VITGGGITTVPATLADTDIWSLEDAIWLYPTSIKDATTRIKSKAA